MAERIVIQSRSRRVVLQSLPRPELQLQGLLVPDGTTDRQVLEWTREWLPEAAWEELRELLSGEVERGLDSKA